MGQEGERKRSTDDVSKSALDDIETGLDETAWDEPGGCLLIGQVVSGMEVARAWFGLWCGTWEPVVPRPRAASGAVVACGRWWKGGPQAADPRGASTDAGHRGGPDRSSDEGPVMGWSEGEGSSWLGRWSTAVTWEEPDERAET